MYLSIFLSVYLSSYLAPATKSALQGLESTAPATKHEKQTNTNKKKSEN